ncbi:uncharacterized protein LOC117220081 [Megalopta genalis]|uniref:uncharacterized protein LOC117220081 n=1 Tax=Megalopta genalis TaxID=115081 RepID=UPI003FD2420E
MLRSIEQQIPRVAATKLFSLQAKMRNVIFLATCFALVAIAFGNNLIIGRRQPGEIVVKDEIIMRPRIWGRPEAAICSASAPAGSEISFVSVESWNPWIVGIRPIEGGVGANNVVVSIIGRPSWGFSVRCIILAVHKKTTTARPTTTPKTTTPKSTTPETTPSEPPTTSPNSTTPETTPSEPATTTPESTTPETTNTEPAMWTLSTPTPPPEYTTSATL